MQCGLPPFIKHPWGLCKLFQRCHHLMWLMSFIWLHYWFDPMESYPHPPPWNNKKKTQRKKNITLWKISLYVNLAHRFHHSDVRNNHKIIFFLHSVTHPLLPNSTFTASEQVPFGYLFLRLRQNLIFVQTLFRSTPMSSNFVIFPPNSPSFFAFWNVESLQFRNYDFLCDFL